MKALRVASVAAMLALLLAGCVTLWGPSEASRSLAGALAGKEIDEATRVRVAQDQPLTVEDIKAFARANVADDLIIGYINATRVFYRLGTAQILDLSNAGVSEKVIDYMIAIPTVYAFPPPFPAYDYYWLGPRPYPWHPYRHWTHGHHR